MPQGGTNSLIRSSFRKEGFFNSLRTRSNMAGMMWRHEHVPAGHTCLWAGSRERWMLALSQLSVSLFNPSPWENGHLYSGWVSSLLITIFGNTLKIYTEVCLLGSFKSHRVAKEHCRNIDDINHNLLLSLWFCFLVLTQLNYCALKPVPHKFKSSPLHLHSVRSPCLQKLALYYIYYICLDGLLGHRTITDSIHKL